MARMRTTVLDRDQAPVLQTGDTARTLTLWCLCVIWLSSVCCDVLYARCWTICRYMNLIFEWSEPNDHLPPLIGCHWHPTRKASEGWWGVRMMMCFIKMHERSHRSTTAGTMQVKSKACCKKLEQRDWYQNCNYVLCEICQWHSQISSHLVLCFSIWLSVVSFPSCVYSTEGLGTN